MNAMTGAEISATAAAGNLQNLQAAETATDSRQETLIARSFVGKELQVIELLAQGFKPAVVADVVGFTPSAISQFIADPQVAAQIQKLRVGRLEKAAKIDDTIDDIEAEALKQLKLRMIFAKSPLELAKIARTMNQMTRRGSPLAGQPGAEGAQRVTLLLPAAAKVKIQVNSSNQVIDVEGKTLAPLPSNVLTKMATDITPKQVAIPKSETNATPAQIQDQRRADGVLADLTTTLNGVQVVI